MHNGRSLAVAARSTSILLLLVVPAVALTALSATAWRALDGTKAVGTGLGKTAPEQQPLAHIDPVLASWTSTQTMNPITLNLVTQARQESQALWDAVRELRAALATLQRGSLVYELTLQSLLTTYAQAVVWETNWRRLGRSRFDQTTVQNSLINLQTAFVRANVRFQVFLTNELNAGSVFSFTPPTF